MERLTCNKQGKQTRRVFDEANLPPLPTAIYYVAVNGKSAGPYTVLGLKQLADYGQFSAESYVWRSGLSKWTRAKNVKELKQII